MATFLTLTDRENLCREALAMSASSNHGRLPEAEQAAALDALSERGWSLMLQAAWAASKKGQTPATAARLFEGENLLPSFLWLCEKNPGHELAYALAGIAEKQESASSNSWGARPKSVDDAPWKWLSFEHRLWLIRNRSHLLRPESAFGVKLDAFQFLSRLVDALQDSKGRGGQLRLAYIESEAFEALAASDASMARKALAALGAKEVLEGGSGLGAIAEKCRALPDAAPPFADALLSRALSASLIRLLSIDDAEGLRSLVDLAGWDLPRGEAEGFRKSIPENKHLNDLIKQGAGADLPFAKAAMGLKFDAGYDIWMDSGRDKTPRNFDRSFAKAPSHWCAAFGAAKCLLAVRSMGCLAEANREILWLQHKLSSPAGLSELLARQSPLASSPFAQASLASSIAKRISEAKTRAQMLPLPAQALEALGEEPVEPASTRAFLASLPALAKERWVSDSTKAAAASRLGKQAHLSVPIPFNGISLSLIMGALPQTYGSCVDKRALLESCRCGLMSNDGPRGIFDQEAFSFIESLTLELEASAPDSDRGGRMEAKRPTL